MTRGDRLIRSDRSKEAKASPQTISFATSTATSTTRSVRVVVSDDVVRLVRLQRGGVPVFELSTAQETAPVAYAVAADDEKGTLWISIEGSTSSRRGRRTSRSSRCPSRTRAWTCGAPRRDDAARIIFDEVEACVRAHVATHGANARVHITGHSIGGSLAMVLGLMLILRGAVEKKHVADVWTFGAPYVLCGGDELLRRLGLERSFIKSVAMGKDIVPRSFSCYYPEWARRALEMAPGSLRVDVEAQRSLLEEEMFYSPVGDMFLLQAMHGSAHPLLPPGPGLYQLAGDGLFDEIAAKVASETPSAEANDELTEADAESHWLDPRGAGWGSGSAPPRRRRRRIRRRRRVASRERFVEPRDSRDERLA